MTGSSRDDAPQAFSLARRKLVVGGLLVTGGLAAAPHLLAQSTAAETAAAAPKFMEVSALLIAHHLDADVGARLAAAMTALHPDIARDIDAILDIAKKKNATVVEDFFPDI